MKLFVFGAGYSVRHYAMSDAAAAVQMAGTARTQETAQSLASDTRITPVLFDDRAAVETQLRDADALLVSAAPDANGDPALARYGDAVRAAPRLNRIIYLSTIGVYGDHDGAWIDETALTAPVSGRNRARVVAEEQWLALATPERPVFVLRLAGIYGPGRNQLDNLREGTARRIVKPGQVFNRIHVADIARAIAACLSTTMPGGIVNVTDDEPAPPGEVVTYAAALLGMTPPPETPFAQADFSPMALSFWGQNKRVRNARLREMLGVDLAYPTYRDGLRDLLR